MLVVLYVWRSLLARIRGNAITMLAVMLFVVGGSLGLSFYLNLRAMLRDSSPPENIIVLSKGAPSESGSRLALETARKLPLLDGVKREGETPLAARELQSRIQVSAPGSTFADPVTIRGFDDQSVKIHRIKLLQGAAPDPQGLDVMIGIRIAATNDGMTMGSEVHLPGGTGKVVGVFSADGGPFEDEVWTPRPALELHIKSKMTSSVTLVAADQAGVPALIDKINASTDLNAQAATLSKYEESVAGVSSIARTVFILLALLSIVATSAIATTMNAAATARMPELSALAAIGIRRSFLARLVMLESATLGAVGAVLGVVLSIVISRKLGIISLGSSPVDMNGTMTILIPGLVLGLAVGIAGGLMPALKVRRLDIMESLR